MKSRTSRAIAYVKPLVPGTGIVREIATADENAPVLRDLKNGLVVAYVVDEGNQFKYIQVRHLREDQIDSDQLHNVAVANLEALVEKQARVARHGEIFAVLLDGNFEASLILSNQLWDSTLKQFVTGQYAVAIPARDILAFCDASSSKGIHELRSVVQRFEEAGGDHPISDHIYVRDGQDWVMA